MLTLKRSILGMALLAGGFLACGDDNNSTPDAASLGRPDAAVAGTGGATGMGGATVGIDAAAGAGGSVIDGPIGTGGVVGLDAQTVDSGTSVVDSGTSVIDSGTGGSVPNKTEHLAIINGTTSAVAVAITGATPPTYDKSTGTCK